MNAGPTYAGGLGSPDGPDRSHRRSGSGIPRRPSDRDGSRRLRRPRSSCSSTEVAAIARHHRRRGRHDHDPSTTTSPTVAETSTAVGAPTCPRPERPRPRRPPQAAPPPRRRPARRPRLASPRPTRARRSPPRPRPARPRPRPRPRVPARPPRRARLGTTTRRRALARTRRRAPGQSDTSTKGGDETPLPEDAAATAKNGERSTAPPVRTRRSDRPRSARGASPGRGPAGRRRPASHARRR